VSYLSATPGFLITYAEWLRLGRPMRDPAETIRIFTEHCDPCEYYANLNRVPVTGRVGQCRKCLCHVSDDFADPLNKIALANTECPLTPPKWTSMIETDESE
jgi:hypothetical protein